jgi:hypothetical protein
MISGLAVHRLRQTLGKLIARLGVRFNLAWVLHAVVRFAGAGCDHKQNKGKKHGFHGGKVYLYLTPALPLSRAKVSLLKAKTRTREDSNFKPSDP